MLHLEPLVRWIDPTDLDLFQFWRWLLAVVCTVYALIITARSLWGWFVTLSGADMPHVVARRYVVVQLLRLRLADFAIDLVRISLLAGMFAFLVYAHRWAPR